MTLDRGRGAAQTLARASGESLSRIRELDHHAANAIVREFLDARENEALIVLEGFHALKHALRFGARVQTVLTHDADVLRTLLADHARELANEIAALARQIPRKDFQRLGPYEPHTGVVSIAQKVAYDARAILDDAHDAPVVLLEEPRHRGNFGAVIRVSAAAEAAGVLSTGAEDPWNPVVVRGAAGLQYAVPVARVDAPPPSGSGRALLAFDPAGEDFDPRAIPPRAVLAFGSERAGVSPELLASADARLSLPMREGVSSLNLATSVAAVLYALRLG